MVLVEGFFSLFLVSTVLFSVLAPDDLALPLLVLFFVAAASVVLAVALAAPLSKR